jgi:hypothetical protein
MFALALSDSGYSTSWGRGASMRLLFDRVWTTSDSSMTTLITKPDFGESMDGGSCPKESLSTPTA